MLKFFKTIFSPSLIFYYKEKNYISMLIKQSLFNFEKKSKWLDNGCGSRPFENNFKDHAIVEKQFSHCVFFILHSMLNQKFLVECQRIMNE